MMHSANWHDAGLSPVPVLSQPEQAREAAAMTRRMLLGSAALGLGYPAAALANSAGTLTWAVHVSLTPTWFDPADTLGMLTPFMVLYALHDAMAKPMPGSHAAPCLAQRWTMAPDGLSYEFVLRNQVKFHNGDPVTAEDVKFSFERDRGSSAALMKDRVTAIETPDQDRVRFILRRPWPDFMTFYGSSGAGWIVPKQYLLSVGDEGFTRAPVGAGPYKYVAFRPGVELVLEAFEGYWRKQPSVKRLVLKVMPDEGTRLAALRARDVDIAYSIRGEMAEELRRTPGLVLMPVVAEATHWLYFPDQWEPSSPWHDQRVRRAAGLAIDRSAINDAFTFGYSKIINSIVPMHFEFFWQPPAAIHDPAQARQLLAEAGFPNGFDAGDYYCDSSYSSLAEAVLNNLLEVGIRARLRPLERAAFFNAYAEKQLRNIVQGSSGAFGNAATRLEDFAVRDGTYAYGHYADLDALFAQQAVELDQGRRTELLHQAQRLMYERDIFAPIWQLAFINGQTKGVGQSGLGLIEGHAYSAPYEDVTIKPF